MSRASGPRRLRGVSDPPPRSVKAVFECWDAAHPAAVDRAEGVGGGRDRALLAAHEAAGISSKVACSLGLGESSGFGGANRVPYLVP